MKKKTALGVFLFLLCMLAYCPMQADAAWKKAEDGTYFYYNEKGKKVKNRWVGNYYVDGSGAMVTNRWVGKYFVGEDGKWIPDFKGGWYQIQKKWYYYTKSGEKRTGWITVKKKRYYLDPETGVMQTKWQFIGGSWYYFNPSTGERLQGWQKIGKFTHYFDLKNGKLYRGLTTVGGKLYCFGAKKGKVQTGFKTLQGITYYFNPKAGKNYGAALKGWQTIKNKRYYFHKKTGAMYLGLQNIGNYTYYFNTKGVMQKSKAVTINGYVYNIDAAGRCTLQANVDDTEITDKMLFFTQFESGTAGYNQTGGDNGNACGYYQFDYRYSLLPFVKYCYSKDPVLFAEFKTYAAYTSGTKLKSNKKFYKAWNTIYNRSPEGFARYQDEYAKMEYYDETVRYLANMGITLNGRSDVVKGAVFSYSIQHGQYTAALAVKNSKAYTKTDKEFIQKIYAYRIKQYPQYKSRYTRERAVALGLL